MPWSRSSHKALLVDVLGFEGFATKAEPDDVGSSFRFCTFLALEGFFRAGARVHSTSFQRQHRPNVLTSNCQTSESHSL